MNELAKKTEDFSKGDRRRLLSGLASLLASQQDLQGATRLWSQIAEQDPNNLAIRLALFDGALQTSSDDDIVKNLKAIEGIDGDDGEWSRLCQVRYRIWKAKRADEKNEKTKLRTEARVLLNELIARRGNWSFIPLALADLEEQELAETSLADSERRAKEEIVANSYVQAIRLGQRSPAVVRRVIQLLFKNGRGVEAIELLNSMPVDSRLATDLERKLAQSFVENGKFSQAEEILRKAIATNPGDFQERIWLVQVLLASGKPAQAEKEIRTAVDLSKSDPDLWIALVSVLIATQQWDKAETAVRDAEAALGNASILPKSRVPLALAQCCELLGRASEGSKDGAAKNWYAEAKNWFTKAQAAEPDDQLIVRRLTAFYLQTKQIKEAESELLGILNGGAGTSNAETVAWARRTLAIIYATSTDDEQVRKALALFPQEGQKALELPEDLRVFAIVLEAQKTSADRKRAIAILESLIDKHVANNQDRFRLAKLQERDGNWLKAREQYRELNLRTKSSLDSEAQKQRSDYLAVFAKSLLQHRESDDMSALTEAQELVDQLKQLDPQGLSTLALEVEVKAAQNQPEKAAELIQQYASRPNLSPTAIRDLASIAERILGQSELAEKLYRQYADGPTAQRGKLELAAFLGRNRKVKEALDVIEPIWSTTREPELVVLDCMKVLFGSDANQVPDATQLGRVAHWMEQELELPTQPHRPVPLILVSLGNIRERQARYEDAKDLYRRAIKQGDRAGVSHNNLAWLMALTDGNKDALTYVNEAIAFNGPKPDFLDTRGIVFLKAGKVQLAINDLEQAVAANPKPPVSFHLAQAYHAANNDDKARHHLKAAIAKRLRPNDLHPLERAAYDKLVAELGPL